MPQIHTFGVIPGAQRIGTTSFYMHASMPGLLLRACTSMDEIKLCGGIAVQLTGAPFQSDLSGVQSDAIAFVGRDMVNYLDGVMLYDASATVNTAGPAYELGYEVTSESLDAQGRVIKVNGRIIDCYGGDKISAVDSGTSNNKVKPNGIAMGVVTYADFGVYGRNRRSQYPYLAGILPTGEPMTSGMSGFTNNDMSAWSAVNTITGYLAKNVSIGQIRRILSEQKDVIFDVPNDLKSARDEAVAEVCSQIPASSELVVCMGAAVYDGGARKFGLLGLQRTMAGNAGVRAVARTPAVIIDIMAGSVASTNTIGESIGGVSVTVPTEALPGATAATALFELEANPMTIDVASNLLLVDTVVSPNQPLQPIDAWTGGETLDTAIRNLWGAQVFRTKEETRQYYAHLLGDVPGNEMPQRNYKQDTGLERLMTLSRFSGTIPVLRNYIEAIFERIDQKAS